MLTENMTVLAPSTTQILSLNVYRGNYMFILVIKKSYLEVFPSKQASVMYRATMKM